MAIRMVIKMPCKTIDGEETTGIIIVVVIDGMQVAGIHGTIHFGGIIEDQVGM